MQIFWLWFSLFSTLFFHLIWIYYWFYLYLIWRSTPDSGYARCQYTLLFVWTSYNDFLFRSVCWLPFVYGGVNVTFNLYQKSFRILAASSQAYQPLPEYLRFPHTTLIQRWNPMLPLSPERHPYSSFNFQGSTIKSFVGIHFCTYFDLMPLYPPLLLMSIALHAF